MSERWNRTAALLVLTLAGGILRFAHLDRPPLWMDEAATYMRVCGSFREMALAIRDGQTHFMPLHYEMCWLLGRFTRLSPTALRFVPALAGTLMIPAVYLLGRQLASRRAALLAAAFACCSAYLLLFSRDAKMYMHFWFCCTLSMTYFLSWLRRATRLRWLAWVASTLVVVGLHAPGLMLLPVQATIMAVAWARRFMRPGGWRSPLPSRFGAVRWAAFAFALAVVAAAPLGYYARDGLSRWKRSTRNNGSLAWIESYYGTLSGPQVIRVTATAFLLGWEWPDPARPNRVPPIVLTTAKTVGVTLMVLLLLGLRPGRAGAQGAAGVCRAGFCNVAPVVACIAVPVCILYAASVRGGSSPVRWVSTFTGLPEQPWVLAVALLPLAWILGWPRASAREMIDRAACWSGVLVVPALVCAIIVIAGPLRVGRSIWVPRYLGLVWPAMAVVVSCLLLRLPTRPLRWGAVALLLGANLVNGLAPAFVNTRPPVQRMAADLLLSDGSASDARVFFRSLPHAVARMDCDILAGPAKYYLCQAEGERISPSKFEDASRFRDRYRVLVDLGPAAVRAELDRRPTVQRAVFWIPTGSDADVPSDWRLERDQTYVIYRQSAWSAYYGLRRCEYVRQPAVAIEPEPGALRAGSDY